MRKHPPCHMIVPLFIFLFMSLFEQLYCANSEKSDKKKGKSKTLESRPPSKLKQSSMQKMQHPSATSDGRDELDFIHNRVGLCKLTLSDIDDKDNIDQVSQQNEHSSLLDPLVATKKASFDQKTTIPENTGEHGHCLYSLGPPEQIDKSKNSTVEIERKENKTLYEKKMISASLFKLRDPFYIESLSFMNTVLRALKHLNPVYQCLMEVDWKGLTQKVSYNLKLALEFMTFCDSWMAKNQGQAPEKHMIKIWKTRLESLFNSLDAVETSLNRQDPIELAFILLFELCRDIRELDGDITKIPYITRSLSSFICCNCKAICLENVSKVAIAIMTIHSDELQVNNTTGALYDFDRPETYSRPDKCCSNQNLKQHTTFFQAGSEALLFLTGPIDTSERTSHFTEWRKNFLRIEAVTEGKSHSYVLKACIKHEGSSHSLLLRQEKKWISSYEGDVTEVDPEDFVTETNISLLLYELENGK